MSSTTAAKTIQPPKQNPPSVRSFREIIAFPKIFFERNLGRHPSRGAPTGPSSSRISRSPVPCKEDDEPGNWSWSPECSVELRAPSGELLQAEPPRLPIEHT